MFTEVMENLEKGTPIIHTITNYVTVNDCANIILASGGSPIMADEITEIEEIVSIASTLVINIGTANERTVDSMVLACKTANKHNIPIVLDPVGVGASTFRKKAVETLMKEAKFSVVKGNITEIKFLASKIGSQSGVDASDEHMVTTDNLQDNINLTKDFAKKIGAVVAVTGAIDIVTDGDKTYIVKNGSKLMSKITGAGCMLACVIGSYIARNKDNLLEGTALAIASYGLAGELAEKVSEGSGSYRVSLIDFMSKMENDVLKEGMRVEVR